MNMLMAWWEPLTTCTCIQVQAHMYIISRLRLETHYVSILLSQLSSLYHQQFAMSGSESSLCGIVLRLWLPINSKSNHKYTSLELRENHGVHTLKLHGDELQPHHRDLGDVSGNLPARSSVPPLPSCSLVLNCTLYERIRIFIDQRRYRRPGAGAHANNNGII